MSTSAPVDKSMSRKRTVELMRLALETVRFLEKRGLKPGEQCAFKEMAERLWHQKDEK